MILDDVDAFLFRVFQLPRRCFEIRRERRAMTFVSAPPSRRDVRQQSMAVLPTPMISTFSPMLSMCPKCTEPSHSMPM